HEEAELD
nr:RecName: Full=Unknown protein from 2D-PAGE of fibroblasts; AltName: Full=P36 [Mus musculus]